MTDAQPTVTAEERTHLRELAREYLALAASPVMREREELWYAHNALKAPRPVVVFETGPVLGDLMPPARCTSPLARSIEWQLQVAVTEAQKVGDDKVVSPQFRVGWHIAFREFDMDVSVHTAADAKGRRLGFAVDYPITDLAAQLPAMKHSVYSVNREATLAGQVAVQEILGDLMPVVIDNGSLTWYPAVSSRVVRLMGMERMLMTMIDQPDAMKALYQFIVDDMLAYMRWQEREGLLTGNNGNHYAGAGSYGFTRELKPVPGQVKLSDLWGNINSQETVGVSPTMFEEFVDPYYRQVAEPFGLVYYGCCEPVHDIWDSCISRLPHLRKVSISCWCDEAAMGERLRHAPVIYSRKPRPNYVGVGSFDEAAFTAHIADTLRAAKGCHLEFIFRDIYALDGDATKPSRAVAIVRKLIDEMW